MHKFEIFFKTIFNSPEPLTFDPGLYVTPVVTFLAHLSRRLTGELIG